MVKTTMKSRIEIWPNGRGSFYISYFRGERTEPSLSFVADVIEFEDHIPLIGTLVQKIDETGNWVTLIKLETPNPISITEKDKTLYISL